MSETTVKINRRLPNGDRLSIVIEDDGETKFHVNDVLIVWVDTHYLRPEVESSHKRDDKLAVQLYAVNEDEALAFSIGEDRVELHSDDGGILKDER